MMSWLCRATAVLLLLASCTAAQSTESETSSFWAIVSKSAVGSSGPVDQADRLSRLLEAMPDEDRIAFAKTYFAKRNEAYDWNIWGAAYFINGGASDDGFEYFLAWLISEGQEVFEGTLREPAYLIDRAPLYEAESEDFFITVLDQLDLDPSGFDDLDMKFEPSGQRWEEDDLPTRFPRLYQWVTAQ